MSRVRSATDERDGQRAGFVTRCVQYVLDLVITSLSLSIGLAGMSYLWNVIVGQPIDISSDTAKPELIGSAMVSGWWFVLMTYSVASFAQTPGMAVMGLRIERTNGGRVGWLRAFLRALLVPILLVVTFGIDALFILGRKRLALHDRILRTRVVYGHGSLSRRRARAEAAKAAAARALAGADATGADVAPAASR